MKKIFGFFCLIFVFLFYNTYSSSLEIPNSKPDTNTIKQKIQTLEDKAGKYYYTAPDTAYYYLDSALQLAVRTDDIPLQFNLIKEKGFLLARQSVYDSALYYYDVATDYINPEVPDEEVFMLKNLQSEALYYHGNIDSALYLTAYPLRSS
jgi:hypothetical protein